MTTEQYLWEQLEKARIGMAQAATLPENTPMRAMIVALAKQAVTNAAQEWVKHVTR